MMIYERGKYITHFYQLIVYLPFLPIRIIHSQQASVSLRREQMTLSYRLAVAARGASYHHLSDTLVKVPYMQ